MDIKFLLQNGREIWGDTKLSIEQIVVRMGKVFGDICRFVRNAEKDNATHNNDELKKELGNIIFSTIRWADDLGYDPEECVDLAIKAQEKFVKENPASR